MTASWKTLSMRAAHSSSTSRLKATMPPKAERGSESKARL